MFGKRSASSQLAGQPDVPLFPETSLQLYTINSESIYSFPQELVQSLRHMLTKLNREQKLPAKISVVSAMRQEGVSLMSLAMAAIMANDLSRNVCLVDLNWWSPSTMLHPLTFYSPGILPLLHGEIKLEAALVHTNHPQFTILPAGNLAVGQRPIVARGPALKRVIDELSDYADHLILDIPAILTTSDAIPLASLGDACCVVVQQGISTRAVVQQALNEINHLPMLGVVMNRVRVATPNWVLKWIPQN